MLALSQTPVYTASPRIRGQCIARCACLRPSFRWYSLCVPAEGWPGWVDLGGWLHTEMVYPYPNGRVRMIPKKLPDIIGFCRYQYPIPIPVPVYGLWSCAVTFNVGAKGAKLLIACLVAALLLFSFYSIQLHTVYCHSLIVQRLMKLGLWGVRRRAWERG